MSPAHVRTLLSTIGHGWQSRSTGVRVATLPESFIIMGLMDAIANYLASHLRHTSQTVD